jgi:hypothetical protein
VQGRMGRTAALRRGSQDELPRSLNLWNFAFLGFCELGLLGFLGSSPLWSFHKFASIRIATPGSTSLNVTFAGA